MSEDLERLSAALFRKSEHLDPTGDMDYEQEDYGWSKLTERKRTFWRFLAKEVILELRNPSEAMLKALNEYALCEGCIERGWAAAMDVVLK